MIKRKADVVKQNVDGIAYLMKKQDRSIHRHRFFGIDKNTIQVTAKDGNPGQPLPRFENNHCHGLKTYRLPFAPLTKKRIISAREALELGVPSI